jgi:SAM-dependent methyltransferase
MYTEDFYNTQKEGSRKSARIIVPMVLELVHPKSVLDVGCGVGTWLSVFNENHVEDFRGIDGEWVELKSLQIPKDRFSSYDLKRPFSLGRKFDLVISLEVAEHLPKEAAERFVDSLAKHGSVILFSAAIPFQGGTDHINEQWPEYWIGLFNKRDYIVLDPIRRRIWENEDVEFWYAQNILMFVKKDKIDDFPDLKRELEKPHTDPLPLVHPRQHMVTVARGNPRNMPFKRVLLAMPIVMRNGIRERFKGRTKR